MRHAMVLGLATLCFAAIGALAYQFDLARQSAMQGQHYTDINNELHKLETQYITQARALIAALNPQDPLLPELDNAPAALNAIPRVHDRDLHYQALVGKVRAKLLSAPTEQMSDPLLQEWRRATDQMNGALHRRQRLLPQLNDLP